MQFDGYVALAQRVEILRFHERYARVLYLEQRMDLLVHDPDKK